MFVCIVARMQLAPPPTVLCLQLASCLKGELSNAVLTIHRKNDFMFHVTRVCPSAKENIQVVSQPGKCFQSFL